MPKPLSPSRPGVSRRGFLAAATACFSVTAARPAPATTVAASDRIRLAMIGCGVRAEQLLADLPGDAEVVATCDCRLSRAERLAKRLGSSLRIEQDYRRLFEQPDLDAAIVCTTDVHHVHAATLACEAGLDVYVEKPLSMYVREGRALIDSAKRHGRIVQTGSQQRSMEINRFACELVRDGGIGTIERVECVDFDDAMPYPTHALREQRPPAGLDWDLWLGPAAEHPYHEQLARHWSEGTPSWVSWEPYGGGRLTGLGSHALDMVQYALGKDRTGPTHVEFIEEQGRRRLAFRYDKDGPRVVLAFPDRRPYRGPRNGAVFFGTDAKVEINRNKVVSNPPDLADKAPPASEAVRKDRNSAGPHLRDWLEAIRTRRSTRADAEVGHRTATLCHLLAIAKRTGSGFRWDPTTERILDNPLAEAMLDRPRRPGWELPALPSA